MKEKVIRAMLPVLFCFGIILFPVNVLAEETQENVQAQEDEVILNDETGIPDVNFYQVLLEAGDSNGDGILTRTELLTITELNASEKSIADITGLEYCTSLVSLDLSHNQITDVTPLRNLNQIRELDITYNNISDLSPLKDSPLTEWLREYAIETQDTYELAKASGGFKIYSPIKMAKGNLYTTAHAKEVLPEELINYHYGAYRSDGTYKKCGITWILYDYNENEEIKNDETGIPDVNLYRILLEIGDQNNDGILTRYEANCIAELDARGQEITSIEGIQYLNNIHTNVVIDLGNNKISDISPLAAGPAFACEIHLDYNQIEDITPLSQAWNDWGDLYLSYNNISDISCLKEVYFNKLRLSHNKISDISALAPDEGKENLRRNFVLFSASYNEIKDITPLAKCTDLCNVDLEYNAIEDITLLADCDNLSSLRIGYNAIKDIAPLADCDSLSSLYLEGNDIGNISVLNDMPELNIEIDEKYLKDLTQTLLNHKLVMYRYLDENGNDIIPSVCSLHYMKPGVISYSGRQRQKVIEGYEPADGEYKLIKYEFDSTEPEPYYIDFYYTRIPEPEVDTSDFIVDTENQDTEISKEDFDKILNENANRNVIFKSNVDITIKFAKGTMKEITGKVSYDMSSEMTRDFDKLDDTVKKIIDKKNLVSYVSYHYSGELPGEAEIRIHVGVEWSGRTLYYYYFDVKRQVLQLVQEAIVDPEGIMTVHQSHCSDYVILSEKITESVIPEETETPATDGQDEDIDENEADIQEENVVNTSPGTGDKGVTFLLLMTCFSGIIVLFTVRKSKIYY